MSSHSFSGSMELKSLLKNHSARPCDQPQRSRFMTVPSSWIHVFIPPSASIACCIQNVVPFWMQHAIDADGGMNTCIHDDGTVINRDRWGWSQGRALWFFSKLFNSIEPLKEWLDIAHGIYRFMS